MGMFDNVKIDPKYLVFPDDRGELDGHDWSSEVFQTKDGSRVLGDYKIHRKRLYFDDVDHVWIPDESKALGGYTKETSRKSTIQKFSGNFNFYTMIYSDQYDYYVEWSVTFNNGKLGEVRLVTWNEEDNQARKETDKQLTDRIARGRARSRRMWYKVYKHVYAEPVTFVFDMFNAILRNAQTVLQYVKRKAVPFR